MIKFRECYSKVTPESAANGDMSEHGFFLPGGWEFPLEDNEGFHEDVLKESIEGAYDQKATLPELLNYIAREGYNADLESGPETNYRTGEETTKTLHIADYRAMAAVVRCISTNKRIV